MKILVADDEATSREILTHLLTDWGHEVHTAYNGQDAWEIIAQQDIPFIILDWVMPKMDGIEVCRRVRADGGNHRYMILLTAKGDPRDIAEGLDAGADDYIRKPFDILELRARIAAGERILKLQADLARRITSLQEAMAQIKTLEGILPICMYCHKIRTDRESWERIEKYISDHSDARFSHGLCPECKKKCLEEEGLMDLDGE